MWGTPPGDPTALPGVPGCHRVLEKIAKIPKNYMKIYMPQNTPNYSSNIHFGPPGYPGGASGAQNLKIAVPGGYLKDRIWVLWNFCPIFGHLTLFGWLKLEILTLVIYHTPLL